ncbi:MAG: type II toxin-antitoxin system Phd/YefM family antitoxin [Terriglobales bacterium]
MKHVGIADFKAHLSQYLRESQDGEAIIITDRGKPVVRLEPAARNGIKGRPAQGSLKGFKPLPPVDLGGVDVVDVLLELRQNHR